MGDGALRFRASAIEAFINERERSQHNDLHVDKGLEWMQPRCSVPSQKRVNNGQIAPSRLDHAAREAVVWILPQAGD
jgi:hypothetical protein